MQRTLASFLIAFFSFCSSAHAAKEILLRLQPAPEAPVIAKVTASEKVILDTAPAPSNAQLGWRQLALPTPFEGYVPAAALSKNFEIIADTPVHYLPTTDSATITVVEKGDRYEIVRVKEEWATVRFQKEIMGYFIDDRTEEIAINFNKLKAQKTTRARAPQPINLSTPEPVAIPAPRTKVNPDQPIAKLDPKTLPPENVMWQAVQSNDDFSHHSEDTSTRTPHSSPIMVSPEQTQARELSSELGPAKTPRLLTGKLIREINLDSAYPVRLQSPEGRLIAYVDFSKIYIADLTPYLDQNVYIRGQIYPLPEASAQLVILAESLKLAPQ